MHKPSPEQGSVSLQVGKGEGGEMEKVNEV